MPATYLDNWSAIIHAQAERARKDQNRKVKSMKRAMPQQKLLMDDMSNSDLLDIVIHYSQQGRQDVREMEMFRELAEHGKKLILNRMKGK